MKNEDAGSAVVVPFGEAALFILVEVLQDW
jgi:hypothetical protein